MPRIIKPAVGSFTASNITIDSSGRVVAASSGAGAANMLRTFVKAESGTHTFTAQPTTTKLHMYLRGAGGGGGGGGPGGGGGGHGGHGGFGFFNVPVSQPFSVPFTLGAGGTGGTVNPSTNSGNAGTASSFNTNLVANAGNGGASHPSQTPGTSGTLSNETYGYIDGTAFTDANLVLFTPEGMTIEHGISTSPKFGGPNNSINKNDQRMFIGGVAGTRGTGRQAPVVQGGSSGLDGSVVIYEDIG